MSNFRRKLLRAEWKRSGNNSFYAWRRRRALLGDLTVYDESSKHQADMNKWRARYGKLSK